MFGGKHETFLRSRAPAVSVRRVCPDYDQHYRRAANADSDSDSTHGHAHSVGKSAIAAKFDHHPSGKVHIRTNCHTRTPADDIVILRILYRVD